MISIPFSFRQSLREHDAQGGPRGSAKFLKAIDYPFQERRKGRGLGDVTAEGTYPCAVTSSPLGRYTRDAGSLAFVAEPAQLCVAGPQSLAAFAVIP